MKEGKDQDYYVCFDTTLASDERVNRYCKEYKNGYLASIQYFQDTLQQGEFIAYFPNGRIKEKRRYISDKRFGLFTNYDSLGNVKREAFFIDYLGKTLLSWYIENKPDGTIDTSKSNFYKIYVSKSDTVSLDDSLRFTLDYVAPYYNDTVFLVIGNFDVVYNLRDSTDLQKLYPKEGKFEVKVKPRKVGENRCIGYLYDSETLKEGEKWTGGRFLHVNFGYYVE